MSSKLLTFFKDSTLEHLMCFQFTRGFQVIGSFTECLGQNQNAVLLGSVCVNLLLMWADSPQAALNLIWDAHAFPFPTVPSQPSSKEDMKQAGAEVHCIILGFRFSWTPSPPFSTCLLSKSAFYQPKHMSLGWLMCFPGLLTEFTPSLNLGI